MKFHKPPFKLWCVITSFKLWTAIQVICVHDCEWCGHLLTHFLRLKANWSIVYDGYGWFSIYYISTTDLSIKVTLFKEWGVIRRLLWHQDRLQQDFKLFICHRVLWWFESSLCSVVTQDSALCKVSQNQGSLGQSSRHSFSRASECQWAYSHCTMYLLSFLTASCSACCPWRGVPVS